MTVTCMAPGVYRVETDERAQLVYVAGARGNVWAFSEGEIFVERDSAPEPSAGGQRPATGRTAGAVEPLRSPMPGTVLRIMVEPGSTVKAGTTAVVMEAMKMELPLRALDDGVVAEVKCREGELVDADAELVTFRPKA
jgi:biotin carboxyl carrier protein